MRDEADGLVKDTGENHTGEHHQLELSADPNHFGVGADIHSVQLAALSDPSKRWPVCQNLGRELPFLDQHHLPFQAPFMPSTFVGANIHSSRNSKVGQKPEDLTK